jgi:hypothetical protein
MSLFNNFIFFCLNNIFFINHVLKFKYPSQLDKREKTAAYSQNMFLNFVWLLQ